MNEATQVGTKTEDQQVQFIQSIVSFLQDASHLPALKREVEGLRAEVEALNRQIADLKCEVELEREAKLRKTAECVERDATVARLNSKLSRLQHRFDTIQGIVQAAMDEATAERRESEAKAAEVYPWPSPSQERSFS